MGRVVSEILPYLASAYGASPDPSLTAFGGSSFGGICALWACMHHPGRFGAALVESPSLWFSQGQRFLRWAGRGGAARRARGSVGVVLN